MIQITLFYDIPYSEDSQSLSQQVYTEDGSSVDFYYCGGGLFSLYPEPNESWLHRLGWGKSRKETQLQRLR